MTQSYAQRAPASMHSVPTLRLEGAGRWIVALVGAAWGGALAAVLVMSATLF